MNLEIRGHVAAVEEEREDVDRAEARQHLDRELPQKQRRFTVLPERGRKNLSLLAQSTQTVKGAAGVVVCSKPPYAPRCRVDVNVSVRVEASKIIRADRVTLNPLRNFVDQ